MRWIALPLAAVPLVIACAKNGQMSLSASANTSDGVNASATSSESDTASAPPPSTPPTAAATAAAPAPAQTAPAATVASDPAPSVCPLTCAIATPRHRLLQSDEQDRLRAAFAPTLSGLHQCMSGGDTRYEGRHWRAPSLTLRFSYSGDLLDVGVDAAGWDVNASRCFDGVVRGGISNPDVRLEGPATVSCVERCATQTRPRTTTRRRGT